VTALVSVVVPVYNGARYLAQAIDSVLAQDYRPLELIVVDDGSEDESAAIARGYPAVRLVRQANRGHGAAKNVGIEVCRGELLAFLDADDLWEPQKLRAQVAYLTAHPECGAVVCRQRIRATEGTCLPAWLVERLARERIAGAPVAFVPSALMVRRTALNRIGTFDPSYRHGNDSDWFFRARDAGLSVGIVEQVLLLRRFHSTNLSYETSSMQADLLRVVRSSLARRATRGSSPPEAV
jgi:glycosyltransferase involved in cell wall biosynthesis